MVCKDNAAVLRLKILDTGLRPKAPITTNFSFLPSRKLNSSFPGSPVRCVNFTFE